MILLFGDGFPKSGQLFIFKLAYRKADTVHGRRPQIIVCAGALNAGDKADVAFIIAGEGVKECGKLLGLDQGFTRLLPLP